MDGTMGHRCEMCAGCPGLHTPPSALRRPGYLWEIAEDTCRVCGTYIGDTLRFLHVGATTARRLGSINGLHPRLSQA